LFVKKLKLLAVRVFGGFSIFRPYFRDSYYILFIFLFYDYRVSPGITGYHRVSLDPVFFGGLAALGTGAAGGRCQA
jgi:hypothetical protein